MKQLLVGVIVMLSAAFGQSAISIIPKPVHFEQTEGEFRMGPDTLIVADAQTQELAQQLNQMLSPALGYSLNVNADTSGALPCIQLKLRGDLTGLGTEGYRLMVTPETVLIESSQHAGLFYGIQTLRQLLPSQVFAPTAQGDMAWTVPCVTIEDQPRFQWRGLHLDESRHFFGAEFVKKYIDLLAMHKMNVFHWHLVDDQGWRLEIKKYPKLTDIAAWRTGDEAERFIYGGFRFPGKDSGQKLYGGYYTQEQIREIVAYAKARHITIVPEIEMPGHSWAALTGYPNLTCAQNKPDADGQQGQNVFCAGREETFAFLEDVLDETLDLFDSPLIHIGGDEVDKSFWRNCPLCQKRMTEQGLKSVDELQSYFIKRIETYLNSKGRHLIGWDEILEGGLAPNATVMSWRGIAGGIAAAKAGHDVVMTPGSHCYFDHYQADPKTEPQAFGGYSTLENVYSFEPVPAGLSADQARHILGAQGNAWAEYLFNSDRVEYMVYPRACALAEVVWSPAAERDWKNFQDRMATHYLRMDQRDVGYRRPTLEGYGDRMLFIDQHTVTIKAPLPGMVIRYTLDGSSPTEKSGLYEGPFTINKDCQVRAVGWFTNGSKTAEMAGAFEKTVLHEPVVRENLQVGLQCRYFQGEFKSVAAIEGGKLTDSKIVKDISLSQNAQSDRFGLIYDGFIKVADDGIYTFYTASDDGSRLLIQGQTIVDNDGEHSQSEKSGQMGLKAGLHPIQILYFEAGGGEHLSVSYQGPGFSKQSIPVFCKNVRHEDAGGVTCRN